MITVPTSNVALLNEVVDTISQCGAVLLGYFDILDIDSMAAALRGFENVDGLMHQIEEEMQRRQAMSVEAICSRCADITTQYSDECAAYFQYFRAIDSGITLIPFQNGSSGKVIEFVLRKEFEPKFSKHVDQILEVEFNHQTPRNNYYDLSENGKRTALRMFEKRKHKFPEITLNADGYPMFYDFNVEFGYITSSEIVECAEFLLRKGKDVKYGNEKRLKAANFLWSKALLTNIYQYSEFIAVFNRMDQSGYVHSKPRRSFQMKMYCLARNKPYIISLRL